MTSTVSIAVSALIIPCLAQRGFADFETHTVENIAAMTTPRPATR
jgi:hypothetical protein